MASHAQMLDVHSLAPETPSCFLCPSLISNVCILKVYAGCFSMPMIETRRNTAQDPNEKMFCSRGTFSQGACQRMCGRVCVCVCAMCQCRFCVLTGPCCIERRSCSLGRSECHNFKATGSFRTMLNMARMPKLSCCVSVFGLLRTLNNPLNDTWHWQHYTESLDCIRRPSGLRGQHAPRTATE